MIKITNIKGTFLTFFIPFCVVLFFFATFNYTSNYSSNTRFSLLFAYSLNNNFINILLLSVFIFLNIFCIIFLIIQFTRYRKNTFNFLYVNITILIATLIIIIIIFLKIRPYYIFFESKAVNGMPFTALLSKNIFLVYALLILFAISLLLFPIKKIESIIAAEHTTIYLTRLNKEIKQQFSDKLVYIYNNYEKIFFKERFSDDEEKSDDLFLNIYEDRSTFEIWKRRQNEVFKKILKSKNLNYKKSEILARYSIFINFMQNPIHLKNWKRAVKNEKNLAKF